MESGWDPDVKQFLVKILNSISLVLLWMIACATAGIYFQFGYTNGKPVIYTIIFYVAMAVTLFLLLRHLYKIWKKE
jgi:membrane protein YdbS with pleckstrin-like domain